MLAFEAELAHLPRSLIAAFWIAHDSIDSVDSQRQRNCGVAPTVLRSYNSELLRALPLRAVNYARQDRRAKPPKTTSHDVEPSARYLDWRSSPPR